MIIITFLYTLVVLFTLYPNNVQAFGGHHHPLRRLAHPTTLALEILPRHLSSRDIDVNTSTLLPTDALRLTLSVFGRTIHLHLRPNEHLVHPAARISYAHTDPITGRTEVVRTEPLVGLGFRAYWGEVVPAHRSEEWMRGDAAKVWRPAYGYGADYGYGAGEGGEGGGEGGWGWARIVVHHQGDVDARIAPVFEGAFSLDGDVHHIVTKDNYMRHRHPLDADVHPEDADVDSPLVIWRESDLVSHQSLQGEERGSTCGHDGLAFNTDSSLNPVLARRPHMEPAWYDSFGFSLLGGNSTSPLAKRQDMAGGSGSSSNFVNSIGSNTGCPSTQRVVYMGVAADCVYTSQYGSQQNATTQILTNWNSASALYKSTFNISLGIIELLVQNSTCPRTPDPKLAWNVDCTTGNVTLNDRLSLFSAWRGAKGIDGAGLWHLMSGCPTGTEVGIAWLGTVCQQTASGNAPSVVSGTGVSTAGRTEWQVAAHEIGHNFGAIHDCTDGCNSTTSCCPLSSSTCNAGAKFVMNPVTAAGEITFSPCSLGNICSLMQPTASGKTNTSCLIDPTQSNIKTLSLQMCGNGIVEPGEDCDPGAGANSTCCDASTCKFRSGASCDLSSSLCCTAQCTFASQGTVCRPAKDVRCDTQEVCNGTSSACPADVFSPDGKSCGSDGLACASGQCTSVSQQCKSAGSSMNLQKACPTQGDKSCQLTCADPKSSNACVTLQTRLVDGSPCGYGGKCAQGNCQPGDLLDTAKSWFMQNLSISIPVSIAVGILALLIICTLLIGLKRMCCGSRSPSPSKRNQVAWVAPGPPPFGPPFQQQQFAPPVRPPRSPQSSRSSRTAVPETINTGRDDGGLTTPTRARKPPSKSMPSDWVDESRYNGPASRQ